MKRAAAFVFSALIMVILVVAACAPAAQGKKLAVAIDANYPPFERLNEKTGQPEGFSVELMDAVAAKAGLDYQWVNVSYDKLLAGVASCQYDLACSSISITDERKKDMLFSDPINSGGQVVIVRKDNTGIKGKDDLAGKTVAAQTAATSAIEVGKMRDVNLKTYATIALVFQNLMDRQCDAAVADNEVSAFFTAKYPDKLMVVGPVFTDEKDGIAVCKKNAFLLPGINAALKALRDDGTIEKLKNKWTSLK
jgi:polar amino acid transport system substrate-binding protein